MLDFLSSKSRLLAFGAGLGVIAILLALVANSELSARRSFSKPVVIERSLTPESAASRHSFSPNSQHLAAAIAAMNLTDSVERFAALHRALEAWAQANPASALLWARDQTGDLRAEAIVTVLATAACEPDRILRAALQLFTEEPDLLVTCGGRFVTSLVANGQFSSIAPFIALTPADVQADWVALTFERWAAKDPAAAFDGLTFLPVNQRAAGFQALVTGWTAENPSEVAEYALSLPDGPDRETTLSAVIKNLSLQDPEALSIWLNRLPPSPSLDPAAAALVLRADAVNRTPEVALLWAQRICDADLREKALVHALREIAQENGAAASAYLANLTPAERGRLLQQLTSP